jgi:predicted acyltransferase
MASNRLLSIDAFRGFTIFAMILVNYPGSWNYVYPPLLHASWNGLTPTDLIFPFFLFIVGISITLAFSKRLQNNASKKQLLLKLLIRFLKIFTVGIFLNYIHHFSIDEIRVAGVLQRIAIVYLVCSLLFLYTNYKVILGTGIGILIIYWITMTQVPLPGTGQVLLEPGNNIAAWIDGFLLPGKMWNETWDPEGVYSTLPAIVTGISGMLSGRILVGNHTWEYKIIWIFVIGMLLSVTGYIWSWSFPINKNLWTSSYVLLTSGFANLILAISIFTVDVLKRDKIAKIGFIFGANAITVYVLADVLSFLFYQTPIMHKSLNEHFISLFISTNPELGSLIYAFLYLGVLFMPAFFLYRKNIFIRL